MDAVPGVGGEDAPVLVVDVHRVPVQELVGPLVAGLVDHRTVAPQHPGHVAPDLEHRGGRQAVAEEQVAALLGRGAPPVRVLQQVRALDRRGGRRRPAPQFRDALAYEPLGGCAGRAAGGLALSAPLPRHARLRIEGVAVPRTRGAVRSGHRLRVQCKSSAPHRLSCRR